MIKKSKEIGATAAKFQLFSPKQAFSLGLHPYISMSFEMAKELIDYGLKIGIDVIFTPMYLEAVEWIIAENLKNPDILDVVKIREADNKNYLFINKILLETKAQVIISFKFDDPELIKFINSAFISHRIKILECVPKYPALTKNYKLRFDGISDHTVNCKLIKKVLRKKNRENYIIEKHVKLEGTYPIEDKWSVSFKELAGALK